MASETLHTIQTARGVGVIRPDDGGEDLPFERTALEAGAFEELREGQRSRSRSRPTRSTHVVRAPSRCARSTAERHGGAGRAAPRRGRDRD